MGSLRQDFLLQTFQSVRLELFRLVARSASWHLGVVRKWVDRRLRGPRLQSIHINRHKDLNATGHSALARE